MSEHWSEIEEVGGSPWHFRFMLWVVCHLPLFLVEFCTAIICFFFWLGAAPVRACSKVYLKHLRKMGVHVGAFGTYKHILSFALSTVYMSFPMSMPLSARICERREICGIPRPIC